MHEVLKRIVFIEFNKCFTDDTIKLRHIPKQTTIWVMDCCDTEITAVDSKHKMRCVQAMDTIRRSSWFLFTFGIFKKFVKTYIQLKCIIVIACLVFKTWRWPILSFCSKKVVSLLLSNVAKSVRLQSWQSWFYLRGNTLLSPFEASPLRAWHEYLCWHLTTAYPYADQTISSIFRLLPVSTHLSVRLATSRWTFKDIAA